MPYSTPWDEASPPGSALANTLDTIIQNVKRDIRERMSDIVADFTTDPILRLRCKVYRSVGLFGVTQDADQVITFDTGNALEEFDEGGLHDLVTTPSRLTIPSNGTKSLWLISAGARFTGSEVTIAPMTVELSIRKDGTTKIATVRHEVLSVDNSTIDTSIQVMAYDYKPSSGAYYELLYQVSEPNRNIAAGAANTWFAAVEL